MIDEGSTAELEEDSCSLWVEKKDDDDDPVEDSDSDFKVLNHDENRSGIWRDSTPELLEDDEIEDDEIEEDEGVDDAVTFAVSVWISRFT